MEEEEFEVGEALESEQIAGDRRRDRRYELHLELRWKLIRRRRMLFSGAGKTLDVSSGGLKIETDRPLPVGMNVELSICWPVLLHNVAPLQLFVTGRIVRSEGNHAAIRTNQHEFRTIALASEHRLVLPGPKGMPPLSRHTGLAGLGKLQ
jgi:hypothetical protein